MYPIMIILWLYSNADFYHGPAPASRRTLCDVEECDIAFQINTLKPRRNGRHFADDILKCIFLDENVCILIKISFKFLSNGPINTTVALVQIMVWCRLDYQRIHSFLSLIELSLFDITALCGTFSCADEHRLLWHTLSSNIYNGSSTIAGKDFIWKYRIADTGICVSFVDASFPTPKPPSRLSNCSYDRELHPHHRHKPYIAPTIFNNM